MENSHGIPITNRIPYPIALQCPRIASQINATIPPSVFRSISGMANSVINDCMGCLRFLVANQLLVS